MKKTPSSPSTAGTTKKKQGGAKKILVLHGPNLNLLGMREPHHYGQDTLEDINSRLQQQAKRANVRLEAFQSNSETELIERIQGLSLKETSFIIINPAAFTHTSVAIRDALAAVKIPFVEVHISNIFAREPFRHHSYFSDLAVGVISGFGPSGYEMALEFALQQVKG